MSELKRHMGLFQLTMYGVGLTLGAGIYVLIGEAAGFSNPGNHNYHTNPSKEFIQIRITQPAIQRLIKIGHSRNKFVLYFSYVSISMKLRDK